MTNYYKIVVIGTQTWFASDLDLITQFSTTNSTGRAYRRSESDSACPSGWCVPTEGNWRILETYLGMVSTELDLMGVSRTSGSASILEDGNIRAFCAV